MSPDPTDPVDPVDPIEPPPLVPRPPADAGPLDELRDQLRDHLARLRDDPRAGAAVLAVVALVAGLLWYRAATGPGGDEPPVSVGATATTNDVTSTTAGGSVFVHVAGAVAVPGLYELPAGARVADALDVAGGPHPDADRDRLNLAAPLGDGQRVYVPKVGEPAPPEPAGASGGGAGAPAAGPVNLNTAGAAELEALPGIGPSIAQAIVAERGKRPFRSVDDLLRVRGIGEARLAELRPHVTV